jgi:very-short-patch-repair endonuclease
VHGSEIEAGDFKPLRLVDATARAIERISHACDIGGNCDSPIEVQIGAAIIVFFERAGRPLKLCKTLDTRTAQDELVLVPQYAWSYYRSDWAILNPARHGALLIECDGKDFHSTISQKIHDQKKDEAAMDRGFLTMRFTGSEIFRDADRCAQKIYDAVCGSE